MGHAAYMIAVRVGDDGIVQLFNALPVKIICHSFPVFAGACVQQSRTALAFQKDSVSLAYIQHVDAQKSSVKIFRLGVEAGIC